MTAKEELRSTPHPALSRRERVLLTAHEMFQVPTNVQTPAPPFRWLAGRHLGRLYVCPASTNPPINFLNDDRDASWIISMIRNAPRYNLDHRGDSKCTPMHFGAP